MDPDRSLTPAPERDVALAGDVFSGESLFAVFSSVSRKGEWLPPELLQVYSVCGSADLDLREAVLARGVTEIHVLALFGSVEVRVPAWLDVELAASAILGSVARRDAVGRVLDRVGAKPLSLAGVEPAARREERYADDEVPPLVRITGLALFGSVTVRVG
jgi:hypothetical protein